MKRLLLALTLALSGCTATQLNYSSTAEVSDSQAEKTIVQVMMEQPQNHRPEGVTVTYGYMVYGDGIVTKNSSFGSAFKITNASAIASSSTVSTSKQLTSRIYFDSIGEIQLFRKRDWFIIQVISQEGVVYDRFYTRSEDKAQRFIDSINHFAAIQDK